MTTNFFYVWLRRLGGYIGREEEKKILLLVNNCSAHGKVDTLPALAHVRVEFLSSNTTSKVEPIDNGIIAFVKNRYRRRLSFRVFDDIDIKRRSIHNGDVLRAMRWICEKWERCPTKVIENCFNHCLKVGVEVR